MIERLSQFIKNQGISVRYFEQIISASDGMIRRAITNKTDIQSKWIKNIADNYPDLNLEWLLTGKGEMLKHNQIVGDINHSNVVGANVNGNGININGIPSDLIEIIKRQQEQMGELIEIINKMKDDEK